MNEEIEFACSPLLENYNKKTRIFSRAVFQKKYTELNNEDYMLFYKKIIDHYKKMKKFYLYRGDKQYSKQMPELEKCIVKIYIFYRPIVTIKGSEESLVDIHVLYTPLGWWLKLKNFFNRKRIKCIFYER